MESVTECPWAVDYVFTDEDKRAFAAALLRTPNDPMAAAVAVFGSDNAGTGKRLYAAAWLVQSPEIIALQQSLLSNGGVKKFLNSKEDLARRVWEWTEKGYSIEDRIKAAKLYAEIMDFLPKPGTAINVTANVRAVMEVPTSASSEQWERELAAQQERLAADAVKPVTH
jgi:hypothetical protein